MWTENPQSLVHMQLQRTHRTLNEHVRLIAERSEDFANELERMRRLTKEAKDRVGHWTPSIPECMQSAPPTKSRGCPLTNRERQVVRLVSLGCSSAEIGRILSISESTADNTRSRAMTRLGITKATLLTRWAIEYGLTSAQDRLTRAEMLAGEIKADGWN